MGVPLVRGRGKIQNSMEGLYIFSGLQHLRILQEELESIAVERVVWVSLLDLLPLQPDYEYVVEDGDGDKPSKVH